MFTPVVFRSESSSLFGRFLRHVRKPEIALWHPRAPERTCSTEQSHGTQSAGKSKVLLYGLDLQLPKIGRSESEYQKRVGVRNLELNVPNLISKVNSYNALSQQLEDFDEKISAISELIKEKLSLSLNTQTDELKIKRNELWEHENILRKSINTAAKELFPLVLQLPNTLHPKTPTDSDVFETFGEVKSHDFRTQSHILLGYMNNCLEFSVVSPHAYYLKGKLALLELLLMKFFSDKIAQHGFHHVICSDFCKSTIMKICEGSSHPSESFEVDEGKELLLRGGASLEAFVSYLTGTIVGQNCLPMKWYSTGRFYGSDGLDSRSLPLKGLFSVLQSTRVHCSAACIDSAQADEQLENIINCTISAYKELGLPFRIRYLSAKSIKPVESLKIELEIWSPSVKDYVCCGHIASYEDLLSQRLMMSYGSGTHFNGHLHIVSACLLSVPPVIACIMENLQTANGHFCIPDVLKSYSRNTKFGDIQSSCIP